jgi:hypothetical protein
MARLKAFFWLAIIGVLVFLSVKLVPRYVDNYQFQGELNNLARVVTCAQAKTEDDVRADVLDMAQLHELPVKSEQIKVSKTQTGVNIEVNYNVVVPVPGYAFNVKFNPAADYRLITRCPDDAFGLRVAPPPPGGDFRKTLEKGGIAVPPPRGGDRLPARRPEVTVEPAGPRQKPGGGDRLPARRPR